MKATFTNKFAKLIVIVGGAIVLMLALVNLGKTITSKPTKAEVVEVLDTRLVNRGRHKAGYKYYTDYLVRFETEDGEAVETSITEMRLSSGQYQQGDTITIDVFSDNTAVAHVYITQKIPMVFLGLFGAFLTYCGIIGKVKE